MSTEYAAAIVVAWFIAGILGSHLSESIAAAHPETFSSSYPGRVWYVIMGPVLLACSIAFAIEAALMEEPRG